MASEAEKKLTFLFPLWKKISKMKKYRRRKSRGILANIIYENMQDENLVVLCVSLGAHLSGVNGDIFRRAINCGHVYLLQIFVLKKNVNPHDAMVKALYAKNLKSVKFLLPYICLNTKILDVLRGKNPVPIFNYALYTRRLDIVQLFLSNPTLILEKSFLYEAIDTHEIDIVVVISEKINHDCFDILKRCQKKLEYYSLYLYFDEEKIKIKKIVEFFEKECFNLMEKQLNLYLINDLSNFVLEFL